MCLILPSNQMILNDSLPLSSWNNYESIQKNVLASFFAEKELPDRYREIEGITQRTKKMFNWLLEQRQETCVDYMRLTRIIEARKPGEIFGQLTYQRNQINKLFIVYNKTSQEILKKIIDLSAPLTKLDEDIKLSSAKHSNLIKQKAEMLSSGNLQQNLAFKRKSAECSKVKQDMVQAEKAFKNLIEDALVPLEKIFLETLKKVKYTLPYERINLTLKRDVIFDTTGLAQVLTIDNYESAYTGGRWHMLKRIVMFITSMDFCKEYAKFFSDDKVKIGTNVRAVKVVMSSLRRFVKNAQEAHISLFPQLQLEANNQPDKDFAFSAVTFNPQVILKYYFDWVENLSVPLNTILNCTDRAPDYVNLIDGVSEDENRKDVVQILNQVLMQKITVEKGLESFLNLIFGTLNALKRQLKNPTQGRVLRGEIIGSSENAISEKYKEGPGFILDVIDGMLDALELFMQNKELLLPLKASASQRNFKIKKQNF